MFNRLGKILSPGEWWERHAEIRRLSHRLAGRTALARMLNREHAREAFTLLGGVEFMAAVNYPASLNGLRLVVDANGVARLFDRDGRPYVRCPVCGSPRASSPALARTVALLESRAAALSPRVRAALTDFPWHFTETAPGTYAVSEPGRRALDRILSDACQAPRSEEQWLERERASLKAYFQRHRAPLRTGGYATTSDEQVSALARAQLAGLLERGGKALWHDEGTTEHA